MVSFRFFKPAPSEVEDDVDNETLTPRGASRERRAVVEKVVEKVDEKLDEAVEEKSHSVEQDWWWKPFWTFSSVLIFAGMLWSAGHHLWQWLDRRVESVIVMGAAQHLDRKLLAQHIAAELDDDLLSVDINTIKNLVSEHPWVRVSSIKRDWPGTLLVSIEEEVPVARWGERGLLNHQGDIFWPELKEEYRTLPRLSGPAPDTERVMSQFHDLNQMLRAVGLNVVSLNLEARGAWTLVLDNQIKVIVGREEVNARLGRFLDLYRLRLSEQAEEIEEIDIRYTHGVAVKWRVKPDDENAG